MKNFILCFFISISTFSYAQTGTVTYNYVFNYDSSQTVVIDATLYFNSSESVHYMSYYKGVDEKDLDTLKKNETISNDNEVQINIAVVDTTSSIYYRNLKTKIFYGREGAMNKNSKVQAYLYEDQGAQNLSWVLEDEFKNISGYNCQKATTEFRGRTYDAWFTTKIPLPYGPWKLGKLPGLILEAYDHSKEISFVAISIDIPNTEANKKIRMPKGKIITHKEFVALKDSRSDIMNKAILARLPKGIKLMSTSKGNRNAKELEYEWNKE